MLNIEIQILILFFVYRKIDKHLKNPRTREEWHFFQSDIEEIFWSIDPVKAFFLRFLGVIRITFGLFLISSTTALYLLITLIVSPVFLLALCTRKREKKFICFLFYYK